MQACRMTGARVSGGVMKVLIVIPARIGSTRFPAKPLHEIAGVSLLARVVRIAARVAEIDPDIDYVVATDDDRIATHAGAIGAPWVMTDTDCPSGSDRALAAVKALGVAPDFVINLQGDAPFTPPEYVAALIAAAGEVDAEVITPVIRLDWAALDTVRAQKATAPFSGTSCIRLTSGQAVWFSKQVLPAIRKEDRLRADGPLSPVYRHVGLYGYRLGALERFCALPVGHYEALEGLEQLRFLENGMTIHAVEVASAATAMWGVDTPEDAAHAEALIRAHGDPHTA